MSARQSTPATSSEQPPYRVVPQPIPLDMVTEGPNGDIWFRIPSWRIEFQAEALKGIDLRAHRSPASDATWTLSEGTTGAKLYDGWPGEPEDSMEDMLDEFVAVYLPKLTKEMMEKAVAGAREKIKRLPSPFAPSTETAPSLPKWADLLAAEGVRGEVLRFSALMERELKANDHKSHWSGCSPGYLLKRLREEVVELEQAVLARTENPSRIASEAADVANFAMMLVDRYKALPAVPPDTYRFPSSIGVDEDGLLPCPFCGGPAAIVKNSFPPRNRWRHPTCASDVENCPGKVDEQDEQGGSLCDCQTDEEARALWNRRVVPSAKGGMSE